MFAQTRIIHYYVCLGAASGKECKVYMKEDVDDVQEIMACGKWNLESMITHEFSLEQLDQALYKASDVNNSLNVIIKMKK